MGRRLTSIGVAAALGLGGLAVAAVNPLVGAGAQTPPATTSSAAGADRNGPLGRALDGLVADGTLTPEQADAVRAATEDEATDARADRKERRRERRTVVLAAAAEALGSTPDAVRAGVADGTSIAGQAEAAGVDRSVVADAVSRALGARLDGAVSDGTLTEEQADKARTKLDAVVDRILDADGSARGERAGRLRERIQERRGS